ncbi:hypothetical protein [Aquimarina sp. 2304DJ70-9]|uniref:hypothetical protein n=1 Tax=Aquimarina penaris TaxID=3231044 RepID=UPI0034633E4D
MKIRKASKKLASKRIQLIKENEYAKIIGKASAIDNHILTSPLGKKKCVYYQVHVTKKTGKNSLETLVKEEKCVDFIIESHREKAMIKTTITSNHRCVHLIEDVTHQSNFKMEASKHLEAYLNTHGKTSKNTMNSIYYDEACIEIGEEISVMGIGNWKESDHGFDRYSSNNLFISGDNVNKLLITDDPKALLSK